MATYDFAGKRALVTGAGKGIGRATVKALANCGAEVIALTRTQADLDSLKKEVSNVIPVCVDVADLSAVEREIQLQAPVHLLVNNAGVSKLQSTLDVTQEAYDEIMSVNVKSVTFISQFVARAMVERGEGGVIVNVSSQASQSALKNHLVYCASKAAVDMLTKVMSLELGPHKIRVNAVNPTVVMTAMGKMAWSDPAKCGAMLERIPLGRFAEEEDIVHAILYLLSDQSAMITGTTLPVDGGYLTT